MNVNIDISDVMSNEELKELITTETKYEVSQQVRNFISKNAQEIKQSVVQGILEQALKDLNSKINKVLEEDEIKEKIKAKTIAAIEELNDYDLRHEQFGYIAAVSEIINSNKSLIEEQLYKAFEERHTLYQQIGEAFSDRIIDFIYSSKNENK
jgi:hypothetical protein